VFGGVLQYKGKEAGLLCWGALPLTRRAQMVIFSAQMPTQVDEDNCRRGLVVMRGPGWEWGEQDGGSGGLGVVLRCFYTQNPYAKGLLAGGSGGAKLLGMPEKVCLAQVRWVNRLCVQTYRVGTYATFTPDGAEGPMSTMTVSDLCVASDQDHVDVAPLKRLYEFRSRRQRSDSELEDIVDLQLGDTMPPPVEMENILLRFFRPSPNRIEQLREVNHPRAATMPQVPALVRALGTVPRPAPTRCPSCCRWATFCATRSCPSRRLRTLYATSATCCSPTQTQALCPCRARSAQKRLSGSARLKRHAAPSGWRLT
jgi:hypothetical protein